MTEPFPPPRQGATPARLAPPQAHVEDVNRQRRRWTAFAVAAFVALAAVVFWLASRSDGDLDRDSTSPPAASNPIVSEPPPTTHSTVAATVAPPPATDEPAIAASTAAETTADAEPVASGGPVLTTSPPTAPVATDPGSTGPSPSTTVTSVPQPTVPATAPATSRPAAPSTTRASTPSPTAVIAPLAADLSFNVSGPDGLETESTGELDTVSGAPAAEAAFVLPDGSIVSQRFRGRDTGDHRSFETNIQRTRDGTVAVIATAPRNSWLTLRQVAVGADRHILVTYSVDRGPNPDSSPDSLFVLDLTEGRTRDLGEVAADTEPVTASTQAIVALGIPADLAVNISDLTVRGDVTLANRLADPTNPLPALVVDRRAPGGAVVTELRTPGRATFPVS